MDRRRFLLLGSCFLHLFLRGLDENALYRVDELRLYGTANTPEAAGPDTASLAGAVFSGSALMYAGCTLPHLTGDVPSVQMHLTRLD